MMGGRLAAVGVVSLVLGCLRAALAAGTVPEYIQADPAEISQAFGPALTARIMSDEFTPLRLQNLEPTLRNIPGLICPENFAGALFDVFPTKLDGVEQAWIERYVAQCDRRVRRAVLFTMDGKTAKASPLMPGKTMATPVLQRDTLRIVVAAAATSAAKDCKQVQIIDTDVLQRPAKSPAPWTERWTVLSCGQISIQDVSFTPVQADGGTDISVHTVKP